MNRKIKIVLSLLLVTCICFAVGCKRKQNEEPIYYQLSQTQYSLKCFEEYQLSVLTNGEIESVEWLSLNASVATVKDGLVIAKGVGSSVIKAVVNGQSLSCLVNVVDNDKVPSIFLSDDAYALAKNEKLSVFPKIMFDGALYDDGIFTFEIANTSICEIQNGEIVGKEYGETVMRVYGEWRGAEKLILYKEVPLSVKRDAALVVNQTDFELYTENQVVGTEDFITEKQLTANLIVNNVVDNETLITWHVSGEDLVSVSDDGLVTVNQNGKEGVAYVWAQVQTNEIDVVSDKIEISVKKPIIDKSAEITLVHDMFEKVQSIDSVQVFGANTEIVSVVDAVNVSTELFKDGKVEYSSNVADKRQWIVSAKTYSVKVSVNCVTKILRTAKDIDNMDDLARPSSYNDKAMNNFSGWFLLGNDIDYGGKTYVSDVTLSNGFGGVWRKSIFDGQGYSISNITFSGNGLFGVRAYDCEFKNVAVINAKLTSMRSNVITQQFYGTGLVDSVFVQATSTVSPDSSSNVLIGSLESTTLSKISNVIVDVVSATNAERLSGITKTSKTSPKLSVFDAVYTIGVKVNVGASVNEFGVYDETDTSKNIYLANVSENNVGYVGGGYETDSQFLSEKQTIFKNDFAKVFAISEENSQTVLKFMGRTVKIFNEAV